PPRTSLYTLSLHDALPISEGRVRTLAGGDLFEFGDKDGSGDSVRLQHPLGISFWQGHLLIADTYNHKIKLLDPKARSVNTFAGRDRKSTRLNSSHVAISYA